MTGRQLIAVLNALPPEKLDNFDLSIKIEDEYFPILGITTSDPDAVGILDDESPVLICTESKCIKNDYEDGECPDCQLEIPVSTNEGDECSNCDHVFSYAQEVD